VDLSGYSKITSALAYEGAHAVSHCVNAYLARLVAVLKAHGGNVVKFAGDAIMVVWAGVASQLEANVYCAARAALTLQRECGVHPVLGTEHEFKIHCGLTSGTLDSEVFAAPKQTQSMQHLYHVISGETVEEIGDLVDLVASGEICISQNCVSFLEGSGSYQEVSEAKTKAAGYNTSLGTKLLVDLFVEPELEEYMDTHIAAVKHKNASYRQSMDASIAGDFIHESVLDALQHGGLSPTQIAQMRELCILFIAVTSSGYAVTWLMEVQEILDRNRCPIVQIIQ
jgi:class 3 adenylate cyclase